MKKNTYNQNNYIPIKKYINIELNKKLILSENKNKIGIYCFTNIKDGQKYVGMSKNLGIRLAKYFVNSYLKTNSGLIRPALFKDGVNSFYIEILEYCDINIIREKELYYINSIKSEYNIKGRYWK